MVDLSDIPGDISPQLRDELVAARTQRESAERQAEEAAELATRVRTIGDRYRAWVLDDTIGADLELALVPRGRTA